MKAMTALNKKHNAIVKINDIIRTANVFKKTSKEIVDDWNSYYSANLIGVPNYVINYLHGYLDAQRDFMRNNLIEFCYILDDKIVSCRTGSNRHYSKFGLTAHDLINYKNGLFWIDSDKPYWIE